MLLVLQFHGALADRIATHQSGVGSAVRVDGVGSIRKAIPAHGSNVERELAVATALFRLVCLRRHCLDRVDAAFHVALQACRCPGLIEGDQMSFVLLVCQIVRLGTVEKSQRDVSVCHHRFVVDTALSFPDRMGRWLRIFRIGRRSPLILFLLLLLLQKLVNNRVEGSVAASFVFFRRSSTAGRCSVGDRVALQILNQTKVFLGH